MDQDGFIGPQVRKLDQTILGGDKDRRHRRGGFKIRPFRQRRDGAGRDRGVGREAGGTKGDDLLAHRAARSGPGAGDHAGAFHAERRARETILQRLFRQQALRPHHVAEIEAGRPDLHLHFVGFGRAAGLGKPFKAVKAALLGDFENLRGIHANGGAGGERLDIAVDLDTRGAAADLVPDQFAVVRRRRKLG